jgi:hypothetical protein
VAQRIQRFGIAQTAKVFGVLYGLMGVVVLPIFALAAAFAPSEAGFGVGFALVLPVLYAVFGFVFVAIGCWLYNLVAGWVGGIEVELDPTTS